MLHSGPSLDKPVQLPTLLEVGLKHRPGHPALMSLEESWSWSELEQRTDRLAGHYLALGLKPGDHVASLMPNRTALIAHYLACFKAGLVTTPLNYRYTPSEIDHALEVSGARIILAHAERAADIAASKAAKLPLGVIIYGTEGDGNVCLERLVATEPPTTILPAPEPDAPAAIFFTSGSTGPAKGVNVKVVQDLAIRQALSYVIDRQNLVDDVFSGQAEPGNGMISPYYKRFFQSYADDPEIGYQHDPEKARQVLADGGWKEISAPFWDAEDVAESMERTVWW